MNLVMAFLLAPFCWILTFAQKPRRTNESGRKENEELGVEDIETMNQIFGG